ncbi:MAG: hypothetical protein WC915_02730 [archaeon]|jgi:hypothetical protein
MINFSKNKAQGTIEYLVIIAVVVVIALVVVGILTGFLGNGSDVDEKSSKIFWSSQVVGIDDSLADADGNAQIVVKNNTDGTIVLTHIIVNAVDNNINSPDGQTLSMGAKYAATLTGIPQCLQKKQAYTLTVKYVSRYGLNKQVGPKDLVIPCTDNITVTVSVGDDTITITGSGIEGALFIWDGADWVYSSDGDSGITIDQNALCFGGTCDQNIEWNGSDLIFNG